MRRGEGFKVVINHEEQYSIWPAERALPAHWREVGVAGPEEQCWRYLEEVWTDMRPRDRERIRQEMRGL